MPVSIQIVLDDRELRRLIRATAGQGPVRIVHDGVEYGEYQEFGVENGFGRGIKIPAHPFMRPAIEAVRPTLEKVFMGAITNDLAEQAVEQAARDVERIAKSKAPWDTGALRNSIAVSKPGGFV